jgi:hypothetical protein
MLLCTASIAKTANRACYFDDSEGWHNEMIGCAVRGVGRATGGCWHDPLREARRH